MSLTGDYISSVSAVENSIDVTNKKTQKDKKTSATVYLLQTEQNFFYE